jgi:hypothetical protein
MALPTVHQTLEVAVVLYSQVENQVLQYMDVL